MVTLPPFSVIFYKKETKNEVFNPQKCIGRVAVNPAVIRAGSQLINQLTEKKYVERGEKDGSWRVFITPSL